MDEPSSSGAGRFDGTMLKFLTHKLRTHSLNEDPNNQEKADDDHDSGTESDDEFQNGREIAEELSNVMGRINEAGATARDSAVPSDADLGVSPPSTIGTPSSQLGYQYHLHTQPSSSSGCSSTETPPIEQPNYDFLLRLGHSDQHSSEEELEVINGPKADETSSSTAATSTSSKPIQTPLPVRPSAVPEKRKWSEANSGSSSCTLIHQRSEDGDFPGTAYSAPVSRVGRELGSSSDEEGGSRRSPVQFRTSPPSDTHKPVRSMSPPTKLFHASFSSSCLSSSAGSSSFEHPHPHHRSHHHRPRSRPRPHSQYHSHTSLDSHHHHHHHQHQHHQSLHQPQALLPQTEHTHQSQSQQQDPVDLDAIGACSPRKRHRHHRSSRPCLDFEKMQQLKKQAVTAWRPTSEHGSKEFSVFCW